MTGIALSTAETRSGNLSPATHSPPPPPAAFPPGTLAITTNMIVVPTFLTSSNSNYLLGSEKNPYKLVVVGGGPAGEICLHKAFTFDNLSVQ